MSFKGNFEEWASKLFEKTKDVAIDVTTLDVTTAVGDAVKIDMVDLFGNDMDFSTLKDKDVTIAGMTRLDLTGDLIEIVHGDKKNGIFKVNDELMKIHKENLEMGIESWNRFFRNLVEVSATIAAILEPEMENRIKLVEALKTKIEPIGKKPD
jgi:hypothetical protein